MTEATSDTVELPAESTGSTGLVRRKPKPNKRRALTRVDYRYQLGRRVKELVDFFSARIGEDAADPITATAIKRCAETVALSEDLRARMLRGEDVSPDDVLRTTRAADALTRRLHLDRRQTKTGPSLADYLRGDRP